MTKALLAAGAAVAAAAIGGSAGSKMWPGRTHGDDIDVTSRHSVSP